MHGRKNQATFGDAYGNMASRFVSVVSIHIVYVLSFSNGNIWLQSPTLTNKGEWGTIEKCPNSTFVSGVQLKVESEPPFLLLDNTGLNGIRFFCSDFNGQTEQPFPSIQSGVGPWGTWRSQFFCNDGLVVGFQLRSEPEQGKLDDTGANNLRLFCSDGQMIEGEGTSWGEWTQIQRCRKRQAICSIQTQVEMGQGVGDDSSLTNLRVECCDIPNPSNNCTPSDYWELIAECDNTNAFSPTTCSYERRIGFGQSLGQRDQNPASTDNHDSLFLEKIGFSVPMDAQILSSKFQFEEGVGKKTGYDWTFFKTDTWNHASTTTVSFEVPPGVRSSMIQVVGVCGNYVVRTIKFQRIDMLGTPPENATNPQEKTSGRKLQSKINS